MSKCSIWLPSSPRSIVEFGPSRLLARALGALGVAASVACVASGIAPIAKLILAVAAPAYAILLANRELRRPARSVTFWPDGRVTVDGAVLEGAKLSWQGAVTVLQGRLDGRRTRLLGWPDTPGAAERRELRLWTLEFRPARNPATVAP